MKIWNTIKKFVEGTMSGLVVETCVYCSEPGQFEIINGNIPERGLILVCARHYQELLADDKAWIPSECKPVVPEV